MTSTAPQSTEDRPTVIVLDAPRPGTDPFEEDRATTAEETAPTRRSIVGTIVSSIAFVLFLAVAVIFTIAWAVVNVLSSLVARGRTRRPRRTPTATANAA